ncbi:MAG: hypothetical protein CMB80_18735 [Flammeovirgaceae bacterium]|nr:hypothetical protein [Flammeovirgaceae bacterium]HCX20632.1 hypothetical protein [Cytophagales bacterium]
MISTYVKKALIVLLVMSCTSVFGQDVCDSLKQRYNRYQFSNPSEEEMISLVADIENCIEGMEDQKEKVIWTYNVLKLHLDIQNYSEALKECNQCIALAGKAYPKYATNCSAIKHALNSYEAWSSVGVGLTHSDKGDTVETVFNAAKLDNSEIHPYNGADYERLIARRLSYPSGQLDEYTDYFKSLINTTKSITQGPFILIGYDGMPKKDTVVKSQKQELFPIEEEIQEDSIPAEPMLPKELNELISFLKNQYQISNPNYYIPIYLYETDLTNTGYQGFSRFTKKIHGRPAGGRITYFNPLDFSVVSWMAVNNGPLYHQIVHAMLLQDYPQIPVWLSEGFASMFEETGHQFVPMDNYRLLYLQQATKYRKMLSLKDLIASSKDDYESGAPSMLYAATSRYFTMFLREKGWLESIYSELKKTNSNDTEFLKHVLVQKTGYGLSALDIQFKGWLKYRKEPAKWSVLQTEIKAYIKEL